MRNAGPELRARSAECERCYLCYTLNEGLFIKSEDFFIIFNNNNNSVTGLFAVVVFHDGDADGDDDNENGIDV